MSQSSQHGDLQHQQSHKLIVLKLDGNLASEGFSVTAELGLEGDRPTWEHRGGLPSAPQVVDALARWRRDYAYLGDSFRGSMRLTPREINYGGFINDPLEQCRQSANILQQAFQSWLNQANAFQQINLRLREFCSLDDRIRVIIRAHDSLVYRLPWHQWDFIDRYQGTEVAFGQLQAEEIRVVATRKRQPTVKILAILGDPSGIDIERDRALLHSLPNADVTFLVQPDRSTITHQLWDQPWDILFFAGHSKTTEEEGRLSLNSSESLSLNELTFGLRQAISQGLQLAIFNSCDGLGLAAALADVHLPQFVVMREPVPDKVAQTFLQGFLKAFSGGETFYRSVRQAREQLQGLEADYPCASWLPTIYQDAAARSLHWSDWVTPSGLDPTKATASVGSGTRLPSSPIDTSSGVMEPKLTPLLWPHLGLRCGAGIIVAGLMIGLRTLGWIQPIELKAYDHLMALRPNQLNPDKRLLVISIDDEDIQYQRQQQMDLDGSLSDTALFKLLQRIEPHRPAAIGLDILHDFEFEPSLFDVVSKSPHIFAICRDKTPGQPGVLPPPNIESQQLGFTNTPIDPDGIIRRQFLGEPQVNGMCQTNLSLGFQLALRYLDTVEGQSMGWTDAPSPELILGSNVMPPVTKSAGGYRLPNGEAGGYQVMINYRAAQPQRVTLRAVLSGTLDSQLPDLIRDRVILIGVVDNKTDLHMTPYNQGTLKDAIAGVMIQAQTVSHLLSVVSDNRPQIRWWTDVQESIWILSWGLLGGCSVLLWPTVAPRWLVLGSGLLMLYVGCLMLLIQGLWIPFIPTGLVFIVTVLVPVKTANGRILNQNR